MPEDHSLHGTVFVIVTQVGTVTIDGSELAFKDSVPPSSPRPASPCPSRAAASRAFYEVAAYLNFIKPIEDGSGHVR